ncbi:caspase-8-like isoform X2 [Coturnix japonica]|uniref:caspase-8-like isoform X2 n=1 Tax=Coturnix japonica TaxID=93934 RepID=UPI0013A5C02C|nr:caspase-8-like isoform X2 [Coturnix japonica]
MSSDFQKLLFDISEALATEELEALKFLSLEHVPVRKQENTEDPKAFFEVLKEKGMIQVGDVFFLKELLYRINRIDLLASHLGSSREEMERELQVPGKAKVSAYRQLLYGIAEDLTPEDDSSVKFLLQEKLPKNKLRENASMLKVLVEMERNEIIKEDDVTILKSKLKSFRADLVKRIEKYEEKTRENDSNKNLSFPVCVSVQPPGQGAASLFVESYKMENNPHGYCVILNNYRFKNPDETREGTVQDGDALKRVFKWLQFNTIEHMNLEAKQMFAKLKEYSKKDHSNMDCFVCFILSHAQAIFHTGLPGLCRSSSCHSKRRLF